MMYWQAWKQRDKEMVRTARQDRLAKSSRGNRRRRPYRTQVAGVLAAAFALSLCVQRLRNVDIIAET